MSSSPNTDTRDRIRRSALWAAYADALGFITEGVDASGVRRRAGGPRVEKTVPWKRRIGGKFGPTVELPAGCLSDDTQLRLATSRSIRGGTFDVETFAKIELTVWPAYALGAGLGSTAAAANLRRRDVTWATNFFAKDRTDYLNGGGNGAAMRVQPHVWSYPPGTDPRALIAAVVTNAVATHGHLRGILGAVFHALCLLHVFERGEVPGPKQWDAIAKALPEVGSIAESDDVLGELWLGQWELHSRKRFADEVAVVTDEIRADLKRCRAISHDQGVGGYGDAVEELEAFRADQRGSGTKSSILAAVAAWLFADRPLDAVLTCANRLGTDTDTIGTMAGAIVGAVTSEEPPGEVADREYIVHEADRMWGFSQGGNVPAFQYPNLVTWTPPRSASDCVGETDGVMEVAGLGPAVSDEEEYATSGKTPGVWQWLTLWSSQRVLAKRRARLKSLPSSQRVAPSKQYLLAPSPKDTGRRSAPPPPPPPPSATPTLPLDEATEPVGRDDAATLHDLTDAVIASDFDPAVVGRALLSLADRSEGIEMALAYAAIITKARKTRLDRERRRNGE